MFRRMILGALAASALAGAAVAQTTPGTTATPSGQPSTNMGGQAGQPGQTAGGAQPTGGSIQMADTATMAVRFVTIKPADVMASRLIGMNVYNNQNESIGEIQDLVIDNGKTITGVVVSVGGFLGIGESYKLVDPATMVVSNRDGNMKAFINTTKDNLKNAPAFTYNKNRS